MPGGLVAASVSEAIASGHFPPMERRSSKKRKKKAKEKEDWRLRAEAEAEELWALRELERRAAEQEKTSDQAKLAKSGDIRASLQSKLAEGKEPAPTVKAAAVEKASIALPARVEPGFSDDEIALLLAFMDDD